MAIISGIARIVKQRQQERKLADAASYGKESLRAFLNHPTNTDLLSHQKIADILVKKRKHEALAGNLYRLGNLNDETRIALVKKGHTDAVTKHASSFTGLVDESTFYS